MEGLTEEQIKQEKKNKIIGISLGLLIVLLISIGASYAYWYLVLSQEDTNLVKTACLKLKLDSEDEALSLQSTYPISDFKGMQTESYTFTVTNTCSNDIDYRIDLDSLKLTDETKRLSSSSVAVLLDYGSNFMENNEIPTYADLVSAEIDNSNLKDKKILAYDTVLGNSTNTHSIRIWVDESSTLADESKDFKSRISIAAGQDIQKEYTDESCFTFDSANSTITGYDAECGGTDVVIPPKIGNTIVSKIGNNAFASKNLTSVEIPRSVTTLSTGAFSGTNAFTKIILKEGLINIGHQMFYSSLENSETEIHNIIFPATVTTIGRTAFSDVGLKQLIIPDTVTSIDGQSFKFNHIKYLKIGTGITSLQSSEFSFNDIENLVIPGTLETVGTGPFTGNPLKSITIEDGVKSLGLGVFYWEGLRTDYPQTLPKEIFVPSSVTSINDSFKYIPATTTIYFDNCKENITVGVYGNTGGTQVYKTEGCLTS